MTASDLDAVVLGGVHRHAAPAAADVEQPHARLQRELAADQVELGDCASSSVASSRAGRPRRCRPSTARAPTRRTGCSRRSGARWPRRRGPRCARAGRTGSAWRPTSCGGGSTSAAHLAAERAQHLQALAPGQVADLGVLGQLAQRGVDGRRLDVDVAGDVGPGEAELARRRYQVRQRAAGSLRRARRWAPSGPSAEPSYAATADAVGSTCAGPRRRALRPRCATVMLPPQLSPDALRVQVEQPAVRVVGLLEPRRTRRRCTRPELLAGCSTRGVERLVAAEVARRAPRSAGCGPSASPGSSGTLDQKPTLT